MKIIGSLPFGSRRPVPASLTTRTATLLLRTLCGVFHESQLEIALGLNEKIALGLEWLAPVGYIVWVF